MKNYANKQPLHAPDTVYLEVTNRCNLKCKHCYAIANKSSYELPLHEIERLFMRLNEIGTFGVVIGGGEPLIRQDIIDIIDLANNHNLLVGLSTNGSLINEKFIEQVKNKISNVQISLDGHNAEQHEKLRNVKGIFNGTLESIKLLSDNGFYVTVATVITKDNIRFIDKIIDLAIENGAKCYRAMKLIGTGRASINHLDSINSEVDINCLKKIKAKYSKKIKIEIDNEFFYKNSICPAGMTSISVDYKGYIYPCAFLNDCEFKLGNIKTDDIHDIWLNSKTLERFRQLDNFLNCDSCDNNKQCSTNCKAQLYYNCYKLKI
jgi:radical SAM protein with 4Fe4S-binding SPASM domain